MEYTPTKWVDKNPDGSIPAGAPPMSEANLNHMEDGIKLAHKEIEETKKELREYSDGNTLHFHGEVHLRNNTAEDYSLYLPEGINPQKYSVFISADVTADAYGKVVRFLPWEGSTTLVYEGVGNSVNVSLSQSDKKLHFNLHTSMSIQVNFDFDLFLVPTAPQEELTISTT